MRRWIRRSLFGLALIAVTLNQGCGIVPDAAPRSDLITERATRRPYRAVPKRRTSRFADIKQATFFEDQAANRPPLAPPPTRAAPTAQRSRYVSNVELTEKPAPTRGIIPVPEPAAIQPASTPAERIAALPSCGPAKNPIRRTQARFYADGETIRASIDDPKKLKKITEIQPFASYEPDPEIRAQDPCENLCPRPDGAPCEQLGEAPLCPEEVVLSNESYVPRRFEENVFAWEASNVHYNPLYFEDFALERYGHTYPCWVQPFASVGKFGVQLVGLPYQMGIDPVCKKMYPLGFYRPGECAPKLHYQIPWNTKAAITQAGVTTGLFFLIP